MNNSVTNGKGACSRARRLTKNQERMKEFSDANAKLRIFYIKGVEWHIVGTHRNNSGSWSYDIKNTSMDRKDYRYKTVGEKQLWDKIKQYPELNKHLL